MISPDHETMSFKVSGNFYRLIQENELATMWEGTTPAGAKFYEVWKRRATKRLTIAPSGTVTSMGALLKPTNEDFGRSAWSYLSKERAFKKFKDLESTLTEIVSLAA